MNKINTARGSISTEGSLFPIFYLIFIYGFVYILPYWKNLPPFIKKNAVDREFSLFVVIWIITNFKPN